MTLDGSSVRLHDIHARPEPFHRSGWVYKEKVDGWRILAYKNGARVRLLSRTGVDHAKRFRKVATAIAALPFETLVLDRPRHRGRGSSRLPVVRG